MSDETNVYTTSTVFECSPWYSLVSFFPTAFANDVSCGRLSESTRLQLRHLPLVLFDDSVDVFFIFSSSILHFLLLAPRLPLPDATSVFVVDEVQMDGFLHDGALWRRWVLIVGGWYARRRLKALQQLTASFVRRERRTAHVRRRNLHAGNSNCLPVTAWWAYNSIANGNKKPSCR